MKKEFRLSKNWDFEKIINKKQYFANDFLIIYYQKSPDCQIGITIPKKFEDSVGRNFYKRQLKAILRELNIFNLKFHLVIIARKKFCDSLYLVKKTATQKLFEKLRNYEKNTKF
ncbi:ribonuclease P protein component [Mycoplasmopsis bovirhinis]|uniref:ribonuclease P protein component n=1 Tax=Mycoplasmopsis bovirhinis TaxID=29553 RepID=UPI000C0583DF|nr:ribonuclease P protein component [Mycoplasmopsis bovirhinis]ATO31128.1 ribonuclease P protein component [Mycoplasmopsis bovirhinis]